MQIPFKKLSNVWDPYCNPSAKRIINQVVDGEGLTTMAKEALRQFGTALGST
jgi:hypothetical protein